MVHSDRPNHAYLIPILVMYMSHDVLSVCLDLRSSVHVVGDFVIVFPATSDIHIPEASINSIYSKLAMRVFDVYANTLKCI